MLKLHPSRKGLLPCLPMRMEVPFRRTRHTALLISSPSICFSLAGKGFGDARAKDDERRRKSNGKQKRVNLRVEAPIPNQGQQQQLSLKLPAAVKTLEEDKEEAAAFALRLAAVRQEGLERRKGMPATATPADSSTAVFDAGLDYASPPSLSQTLMSQLNSDVSDPKLKAAQFGPNQVGVAVAAVLLVLMFVVVSGGDLASSKRYKGVGPAQAPPDGIEAAIIRGRISKLDTALLADPSNVEALEEEAVSYAQLFEFEKSAGLLDKLVAAQPGNAEAWRLLGETTLLAQQAGRSVAAYEKAAALSSDDLQVLTGLADAYIANGQPAKAIDFLTALKAKRSAAAAPPPASSSASAPAAAQAEKSLAPAAAQAEKPTAPAAAQVDKSPVPAAAQADKSLVPTALEEKSLAPAAAQADKSPTPAAALAGKPPGSPVPSSSETDGTPSASSVDSAALELLLAKVYGSWRGHDSDALAAYDGLIKSSPTDFRAYLAKGLFLKEHGRKADAERMFIQARFFAPESRQGFIKRMTETNPLLEVPD